jgi:hypothetical protein
MPADALIGTAPGMTPCQCAPAVTVRLCWAWAVQLLLELVRVTAYSHVLGYSHNP